MGDAPFSNGVGILLELLPGVHHASHHIGERLHAVGTVDHEEAVQVERRVGFWLIIPSACATPACVSIDTQALFLFFLAVGLDLFFVAEAEFNGRAAIIVNIADLTLEIAFIAPVNEL